MIVKLLLLEANNKKEKCVQSNRFNNHKSTYKTPKTFFFSLNNILIKLYNTFINERFMRYYYF